MPQFVAWCTYFFLLRTVNSIAYPVSINEVFDQITSFWRTRTQSKEVTTPLVIGALKLFRNNQLSEPYLGGAQYREPVLIPWL